MGEMRFYTFQRYFDKTDGKAKMGYLRVEGYPVEEINGLDLGVYKGGKFKDEHGEHNWWHVVDLACGLSVGTGTTKANSIEAARENLNTIDMVEYAKKRDDFLAKNGNPPGHAIMYNLVGGHYDYCR